MNKLIILGNGFDIAHGLKTSYKDYLSWLNQEIMNQFETFAKYKLGSNQFNWNENTEYYFNFHDRSKIFDLLSDDLNNNTINTEVSKKTIQLMRISDKIEKLEYFNNEILFKSDTRFKLMKKRMCFVEKLLLDNTKNIWSDIEYEFFCEMKKISSNESNIDILTLNNQMLFIKVQLHKYLTSLSADHVNINENIIQHLFIDEASSPGSVFIIDFNYTETGKCFFDKAKKVYGKGKVQYVQIHGNLNTHKPNDLIFGFSEATRSIIDLNDNRYFINIKQNNYPLEDKYKQINGYINSFLRHDKFDVYILGHSCGLSDRVLLKEIFEHEACNEIIPYHHYNEQGDNNYFDITTNISRTLDDQRSFNSKIKPKHEDRLTNRFFK